MTPIITTIAQDLPSSTRRLRPGIPRSAWWLRPLTGAVGLLLLLIFRVSAAEVRFDMFLGYDNVVPEFSWFPVTFEIQNDGPTFIGRVEVAEGSFGQKLRRSFTTELPTGTLKRFTIPMFKTEAYQREWTARLVNEQGKEIANTSRQMRRRVHWRGLTIGALARNQTQAPAVPVIASMDQDSQPAVSRMIPDLLPDNPLVWEGLSVLYLNSERALALKAPQVNALVAWLWGGGHLIVNLEQAGDLSGAPWLRRLLPAVPGPTESIAAAAALHRFSLKDWAPFTQRRNPPAGSAESDTAHPSDLTEDENFASAALPIMTLNPGTSTVVLEHAGKPLVISSPRGRGKITLLAFNAEREPFQSWAHRPWFWGSLCGMREQLRDFKPSYTYRSTDGLMGAVVDSTQIRKLPVGWLLLLLVAYLVVIGPFDRWWLKRINREMLTWITFPCYVVAFSFLIYLIGYRLRAGETEWNEFQIIDLIPFGEQAQWRTRSFGSVYSPSNRRFDFASEQPFASFRSEANPQGAQDSSRGAIDQTGYQFKASVPVPVWTSQLFVHDSMSTNVPPIEATFDAAAQRLTLNNQLGRAITSAYLVHRGQVYEVKNLAPGTTTTPISGMTFLHGVDDFVRSNQGIMQNAVDQRRQAFGADRSSRVLHPPEIGLFASFSGLTVANGEYDNSSFATTPGLDVSRRPEGGSTLLLVWVDKHAGVPGFNRFDAMRRNEATLYRLIIPSSAGPRL